MATKALTVKADEIIRMADSVAKLGGEDLKREIKAALNTTIASVYQLGGKRITEGLNLPLDYVQGRLRVDQATDQKLEASITAPFAKDLVTRLASYGATYVLGPNKNPGRVRATGFMRIPAGQKQVGVQVTVQRGQPKQVKKSAFLLPFRKGRDGPLTNKLGVFVREDGRTRQLLGPSVYQLFRKQVDGLGLDELALDELETNLGANLASAVEKAF